MERQCCRLPGSKHCLAECKTTRQALPAAHQDNLRHGAAGFLGRRKGTYMGVFPPVFCLWATAWSLLSGSMALVLARRSGTARNGLWSRAHATCSIYLMQKALYKVCHCYEAFPPKNEIIQFLWVAFKNEIGSASATRKAKETLYHLCGVLVTFSLNPLQ